MRIVVIGGSGLIGSKTAERLRRRGHDVVAASPASGVNTVTGQGLDEALHEAEVVVDVANSPSLADAEALAFFTAAGRNLAVAEQSAGVRHHVALSVVGTQRLQDIGYFRAKQAQEEIVRAAGIPFTIVRATQFFEFLGGIARSGTVDGEIRLTDAAIQPVAADDVADAVANAALAEPVNGAIELAGPERFPLDELVRRYLAATGDGRAVVTDPEARYFGARLTSATLMPAGQASLGRIRLDRWLSQAAPRA